MNNEPCDKCGKGADCCCRYEHDDKAADEAYDAYHESDEFKEQK